MRALWILAAAFMIAVAGLLGVWTFSATPFVSDVTGAATKLIASLLIVTLFTERSLAAINAAVFGPVEKMEISRLRDLEVRIESGAADGPSLLDQVKVIRDKLAEISGKQERVRVVIGFVFAVLISSAGIRTLSALLMVDGAGGLADGEQKDFAHAIDIILTAGLIAGGSNGLNQLLQIIRNGMTPPSRLL
jgi:hypothetical protein